MLEVVGVAAGYAKNITKTLDSGNIEHMLPTALFNAISGVRMAATGEYRGKDNKLVQEVDLIDATVKAIGFNPSSIAAEQRATTRIMRSIDITRAVEGDIADRMARGMFEGDAEAVEGAREHLMEWNRAHSENPITIDHGQIIRRIRTFTETKEQRLARSAPPAMRAGVMQEMRDSQRQ